MQTSSSHQISTCDVAANPVHEGQTRAMWMDFARGFGVILVVFGHVLDGLVASRVFPEGRLATWMIYSLYTFHMPLFFFLAGLNVQHSLQRGTGRFLLSKVSSIAYPYVLWSLIQGGIVMMLAGNANHPLTATDLAAIWYRPIGQFWFLYALMICQILAVVVPSRTLMISIAAVSAVVFQFLPVQPDLSLTLHHLPFFVAGIYLTRSIMTPRAKGTAGWIALCVTGVAFATAVAAGGTLSGMDWNGVASLPACILGIAGMVLFCQLLGDKRHRCLAIVGMMSMTIYVMHIMASSGLRIVMLKLHVPPLPWFYLLAGTAVGVIVPMIAHVILQRMHLLAALGLAPWAMRKPAVTPTVGAATASDQAMIQAARWKCRHVNGRGLPIDR